MPMICSIFPILESGSHRWFHYTGFLSAGATSIKTISVFHFHCLYPSPVICLPSKGISASTVVWKFTYLHLILKFLPGLGRIWVGALLAEGCVYKDIIVRLHVTQVNYSKVICPCLHSWPKVHTWRVITRNCPPYGYYLEKVVIKMVILRENSTRIQTDNKNSVMYTISSRYTSWYHLPC